MILVAGAQHTDSTFVSTVNQSLPWDQLPSVTRLSNDPYQVFFFFFFFFCFLGPQGRHMEVPKLRIQSELLLLAYATATAMEDPSCICDLHHSSQPHRILNPLSETGDGTHILMDTSRVSFCCATMGTPLPSFLGSLMLLGGENVNTQYCRSWAKYINLF